MTYALLLEDPGFYDPMRLARALAQARRTPVQDQISVAKGAWGIVAESLPREEAEPLKQALDAAGISVRLRPTESLTRPPEPEPLRRWDQLSSAAPFLIAAAAWKETQRSVHTTREGPSAAQKIASAGLLMATGLPIRVGPKTRVVEKTVETSDLRFRVDLLWETPPRRQRVDGAAFDYAFLGPQKQYQLLGNFKATLARLAERFPDARSNRGQRLLLGNSPLASLGYESDADLDREIRWLWNQGNVGR